MKQCKSRRLNIVNHTITISQLIYHRSNNRWYAIASQYCLLTQYKSKGLKSWLKLWNGNYGFDHQSIRHCLNRWPDHLIHLNNLVLFPFPQVLIVTKVFMDKRKMWLAQWVLKLGSLCIRKYIAVRFFIKTGLFACYGLVLDNHFLKVKHSSFAMIFCTISFCIL